MKQSLFSYGGEGHICKGFSYELEKTTGYENLCVIYTEYKQLDSEVDF